jgi:hypothetical protein
MNHAFHVYYLIGCIALIIPGGAMGRRDLKVITFHEVMARERYRWKWAHLHNLFDLVRAAGGLWLVTYAFHFIRPMPETDALALLATMGVAAAGLALQFPFHRATDDDIVAPIAYGCGLVVVTLPWIAAGLVLALIFASMIALKNVGFGLTAGALAAAALGFLFKVPVPQIVFSSVTLITPVLLVGLLPRRLVITVRPGRHIRDVIYRDVEVLRKERAG